MRKEFERMKKEFVGKKETKSNLLSLSLLNGAKLGKIHSIFVTTFNILIGDQLIHFGREKMPVSAHGVIIRKVLMDELLENGQVGDIVRYKNGVFTVYTRKKLINIKIEGMDETDLTLPSIGLSKEEIKNQPLFEQLNQFPFWEHIGIASDEKIKQYAADLENFSRITEQVKMDLLQYLIGRGGGLTPSGDDLVVGFTMAQKIFNDTSDWDQLLKEMLTQRNTTDISKAYYKAALKGYFSELFIVLVRALEWASEENVENIISLVRTYGHTSGTDTLFGFTLGLRSIINEKRDN